MNTNVNLWQPLLLPLTMEIIGSLSPLLKPNYIGLLNQVLSLARNEKSALQFNGGILRHGVVING
jgi:hypothetical protein